MHKKEKERLDALFVWSTLYDIYIMEKKRSSYMTLQVSIFFSKECPLLFVRVCMSWPSLSKRIRLIPYNKVERGRGEKVFCFFFSVLDKYWIREIEDIVNKVRKRTIHLFYLLSFSILIIIGYSFILMET
jgi:hypothetical protein